MGGTFYFSFTVVLVDSESDDTCRRGYSVASYQYHAYSIKLSSFLKIKGAN